MTENLIEVREVKKVFRSDPKQELLVLDHVNFSMRSGEIVALVGRSGSGKSTLLRIMAGLIEATDGNVLYRGQQISGPARGISMVFQNFALLPWLTVLQNVELGLEALKVEKQTRRQRALKAIDIVGLDGFESAFPKELSGGMCQRVGLARALVVNPDLLLMDEPFSALDVLTADNLRRDVLDLWEDKQAKLGAMLIVTHNIEEALLMADRIMIFDANPGYVKHDITVDLPRPRDDESLAFRQLLHKIYTLMTTPSAQITQAAMQIDMSYRVPDVQISELAGLIETIDDEELPGAITYSDLAELVQRDVDELISLTEVLDILRFATSKDGGIYLTQAGKQFAKEDLLEQKKIFAHHLLHYLPIAQHICDVLRGRYNHRVSKKFFLGELEEHFSDEDAERVLRVVIEWGRYAELFAYDDNTGKLSLEDPT
jgi:NitT/TauT family transport system ATP-binding protein